MSPERRHLTTESIMRIEVSLSSRKSSVVVFNTTARLVALAHGEWSSVAYGAPCILLVKHTTAPDSPFQVRLAIVEVESGIVIWEEEITAESGYMELQPIFHSFTVNQQSLALQFADAGEASSLIESLQQYIAQKHHVDELVKQGKNSQSLDRQKVTRKSKKKQQERKLSKIEISLPCEFRHLSGITAGTTDLCKQELEGSIRRKQRSVSLSAISQKNMKHRGRIPDNMIDNGDMYSRSKYDVKRSVTPTEETTRSKSKFKFSSLRITKKKHLLEQLKKSNDDILVSSSHVDPSDSGHYKISDICYQQPSPERKIDNNSREDEGVLVASRESSPQVPQGWKDDTGEELKSRFSSQHVIEKSTSVQSPQHVSQSKSTWPDAYALTPVTLPNSPQSSSTSPKHHDTIESLMKEHELQNQTSPTHRNAGSYQHVKPSCNTYDVLLPLDPNEKLPPLPPLAPISKNKKLTPQKPEIVSPISQIHPEPPPLSVQPAPKSPRSVDSPSDLDHLSAELSKILQDFDDLIAPRSPLETNFESYGNETMV